MRRSSRQTSETQLTPGRKWTVIRETYRLRFDGALSGCSVFGASAIRNGRTEYNKIIHTTSIELSALAHLERHDRVIANSQRLGYAGARIA